MFQDRFLENRYLWITRGRVFFAMFHVCSLRANVASYRNMGKGTIDCQHVLSWKERQQRNVWNLFKIYNKDRRLNVTASLLVSLEKFLLSSSLAFISNFKHLLAWRTHSSLKMNVLINFEREFRFYLFYFIITFIFQVCCFYDYVAAKLLVKFN